jgi:hypothetical protein
VLPPVVEKPIPAKPALMASNKNATLIKKKGKTSAAQTKQKRAVPAKKAAGVK